MISSWVLVYILVAGRSDYGIKYVTPFNTLKECEAAKPKESWSWFSSMRYVCAPVIKE